MRRALAPVLAAAAGLAAAAALDPSIADALPPILRWPGPGPQVRARGVTPKDVVAWNTGCEHCHQAIASEWRTSRHHAAFTNPSFQAALSREPSSTRGFCVRCHAPESQAKRPGEVDEASSLGVACLTCHVPLGPVLASTRGGRPAPHATTASVEFRSVEACRGCHEFAFPNHREERELMQRTISEHQESGREAACTACHMPSNDGHRGHSFPGGYDEALVRSSLVVKAERQPGVARVILATKNVTHAVPTGDLFRRLAVEVVPLSREGARLGPETRYLTRHYEVVAGERRELGDDRPHLTPREVAFSLPVEATGFEWRVRYERVGFHPNEDEGAAEVESAFDVAAGVVR